MHERSADAGRDPSADDFIERLRRRSPLFKDYTDDDITDFLLQCGRTAADRAEALSSFQHALAMAQRTGNRDHEFQALCELGYFHGVAHEHDRAHERFEEALAIAIEADDTARVAACRLNQADTYFNQGDAGEALRLYQLAIASGSLTASATIHAHINQGRLLLAADRCADSLVAFQQAEYIAKSQSDEERAQRAREHIALAQAECEPSLTNELTLSLIASFDREGAAAFQKGDFETAREMYERGLAVFRRLDHVELQAAALRNISRAEAAMSAFSASVSHANLALELDQELQRHEGIALCHWQLGDVARLQGDYSDALAHLTGAMQSLQVCGDHTRGCVLSSLGFDVRRARTLSARACLSPRYV